jgi:hypothetical protein
MNVAVADNDLGEFLADAFEVADGLVGHVDHEV